MNASSEGGLSPYQEIRAFLREVNAGYQEYERTCRSKAQHIVGGLERRTGWIGSIRILPLSELEQMRVDGIIGEDSELSFAGEFLSDGKYRFWLKAIAESDVDILEVGWVLSLEQGEWKLLTSHRPEPIQVNDVEKALPEIEKAFVEACCEVIAEENFWHRWSSRPPTIP